MLKRFFLVLVLLLFLMDAMARASTFYTIQTGTFYSEKNALKHFNIIRQRVPIRWLLWLRAEKAGRFYVVRVGRFPDRVSAKETLKIIQRTIKDAVLVKTSGADEVIKILTPEDIEIELNVRLIKAYILKGDLNRAEKEAKKALSRWPKHSEFYGLMGTIYLKRAKYLKAYTSFSRAISLNDKVAEYYNGAGYALLSIGRVEEALFDFQKALKLKPDYADALAGTAYCYIELGLKDDALMVYNHLKGIDPEAAKEVFKALMYE
ncbi:MAG: tetratricopeptide repeat protein [Nitrospirae bacterium]|nr:tetratricopeptide repeat protein [Nitrospirota bacterium]